MLCWAVVGFLSSPLYFRPDFALLELQSRLADNPLKLPVVLSPKRDCGREKKTG